MHGLLPSSARIAHIRGGRSEDGLFPEERALVEHATAKRRQEFAAVRACARDAIAQLGLGPRPILPGPGRAPRWPPGVVGSMTHCDGYCAAAVAWRTDLASVGIDAEPDAPLPGRVLDGVRVPDDAPGLRRLVGGSVCADRLLFSAKEAVYKAWYPLARRWLGFDDATVDLRPNGTFTARLLIDGSLADGRRLERFDGRWAAVDGMLLTAVSVPGLRGRTGSTRARDRTDGDIGPRDTRDRSSPQCREGHRSGASPPTGGVPARS